MINLLNLLYQEKKNNIDKFVKECYVGPIFSNVKTIDLKKLPFLKYKDFEIKYS